MIVVDSLVSDRWLLEYSFPQLYGKSYRAKITVYEEDDEDVDFREEKNLPLEMENSIEQARLLWNSWNKSRFGNLT